MSLATVQAVSTTAWTASISTLTITKPTGTVDGDYLLAFVRVKSPDAVNSIPSGWAQKANIGAFGMMRIYEKVASSEGASWAWGLDATTTACGAVLRIDGQKSSGAYDQISTTQVDNSATPDIANTITPSAANSLLIFLVDARTLESDTGVASYAIVTSNPTWTEHVQLYSAGEDSVIAVASASRPQATATGNSSCALGTANTDTRGTLLSILSEPNITVTPSVVDLTLSVQAPAISGGAVVTIAAPVDLTLSVQAPTVSSPSPDWTNADKSSTSTFTNPDKS